MEINFSYTDLDNLIWNGENGRYDLEVVTGACGELSQLFYLGNTDDIGTELYPDIVLNNLLNTNIEKIDCDCIGGTLFDPDTPPDRVGVCVFTIDDCLAVGGTLGAVQEFEDELSGGVCTVQAEVHEDKYDSLVYIAEINYNDLNGFTFTGH